MILAERTPEFSVSWRSGEIRVSALCRSTHQVDALIKALTIMRASLPSHRDAVAGDFGIQEPPVPFAEQVRRFLG